MGCICLQAGRVQIVKETLPALAELKAQGRVRHIGITGLPLKIFESVLQQVLHFGDAAMHLDCARRTS